MKKYLNPENFILIAAVPMLCFLLSRSAQLFADIFGKNIPIAVFLLILIFAEYAVFILRGKISEYLNSFQLAPRTTAFAICLSVLLSFAFNGIILRNCVGGGTYFDFLGAMILLSLFLSILFSNISHIIKKAKRIKPSKTDIIFLVSAFIILNAEALVYCKYMKQIFYWDNAGYFTTVHSLDAIFPFPKYWKSVFESIFTTDYNYIIAIPASIMCKLFGKSRLVFILSIINFYVFPLTAVIYGLTKRIFKGGVIKAVSVFLCLPYLIFMANAGFIDIGCALFGIIALSIYLYLGKEKCSLLVGVLLAFCILMRRWYSFFALSFALTALLYGLITKKLKAPLEILGGCGFVLLFFTQDFVTKKLLADYSNMYAAYALGIRCDAMLFTRYYGVILTATLVIFTIIKQVKNRKNICPESFILLQSALCFSMFVSVQTHGQQHLALYVPAFCILLMSLLSGIQKKHLIIASAILCSLQTVNTFIPRVQPTSIQGIKKAALIPNFSNYPSIDKNADKILQLTEYMDESIGLKGKSVCLLASSFELNYDILTNAEASLSAKVKHNIDRRSYFIPLSDVDKRDGLSDNLFITDYILVPSSLQIHLGENEQRVISVPYEKIISKEGFGAAYEKENVTFNISDDTEVYLYRRTRDITPEEKSALLTQIFDQ